MAVADALALSPFAVAFGWLVLGPVLELFGRGMS